MKIFDVRDYGAVGDGKVLDTGAIQRAIDAAEAGATASQEARVLLRGGGKYLIGTLRLKSYINFHLADDAQLLVSTNRADYTAHADVEAEGSGGGEAVLIADGAEGLRISGTGTIDGRSREFMERYDAPNEWWVPKGFRPRLLVLTGCRDLEIQGVTLRHAPFWACHLLGCRRVLVDGLRVRNEMEVPNGDGINPDHCQDVEIRNCDVQCGDDGIVIKATRNATDYGPCERIVVKDCTIETQDSGLKIGTETTSDIRDIRFERCRIKSSCRGIGILLRDEGSVYNVVARDIELVSRYQSDPWWGRGEAISLTAIPRMTGGKIGTMHDIRLENVTCRAENSVRINGSARSRIRDVTFENVAMTLERWTKYRHASGGGVFDNRPTKAQMDLEPHDTVGISVRHADRVMLKNCGVAWGENVPEYFSHALQAEDVTELNYPGFRGEGARAGVAAIDIR